MKLLLSGPVEGYLEDLFNLAKEKEANWIICAGDFGVFPDPQRMDRASRIYASKEFSLRYVGADARPIRIPVLFIAGVHDDNKFLQSRVIANNTEVLSNVHFLAQGYRTNIGFEPSQPSCRVTGLGRAYSAATYNGQRNKRSLRHYTRRDTERACSSGPTDLLVVYEHIDFPGIRNIIYATRPKLILTVDHNNRKQYDNVQGIDVITLNRREFKIVQWVDGRFVY